MIGEVPAFYFHLSSSADFSKFDRKMAKGNWSVARVVWTAGDTCRIVGCLVEVAAALVRNVFCWRCVLIQRYYVRDIMC